MAAAAAPAPAARHPRVPRRGSRASASGRRSPISRASPAQPNQSQPSQPNQSGQPGQPNQPAPLRGRGANTSTNWSGYAASGGTFTAVSGTWKIPEISSTSTAGADATWVGIGGVGSRDLIQAGTQQSASGSGSSRYEAWVETLPQASHPVPFTVHPGDSVTISITLQPQTQDEWLIAFKNNTTSQTFQVTEHYSSSRSSAEWIEEAPSAGRGQVPLDNFGTVNFSDGSAVKDGQTVIIGQAGASPITMIGRGGQPLASPSALGSDGASFSVSHS